MKDLVFVNFNVSAARLRKLVPEPLALDRPDGAATDRAFVSAVSFRTTAIKFNGVRLPLPGYNQVNYRAYVRSTAGPTLWFLSIRPGSRLAALSANLLGVPAKFERVSLVREQDKDGPRIKVKSNGVAFSVTALGEPARQSAFITERPFGYIRGRGAILTIRAEHSKVGAVAARADSVSAETFVRLGLLSEDEAARPESVYYAPGAAMLTSVTETTRLG